jgi:hypothetical protein
MYGLNASRLRYCGEQHERSEHTTSAFTVRQRASSSGIYKAAVQTTATTGATAVEKCEEMGKHAVSYLLFLL